MFRNVHHENGLQDATAPFTIHGLGMRFPTLVRYEHLKRSACACQYACCVHQLAGCSTLCKVSRSAQGDDEDQAFGIQPRSSSPSTVHAAGPSRDSDPPFAAPPTSSSLASAVPRPSLRRASAPVPAGHARANSQTTPALPKRSASPQKVAKPRPGLARPSAPLPEQYQHTPEANSGGASPRAGVGGSSGDFSNLVLSRYSQGTCALMLLPSVHASLCIAHLFDLVSHNALTATCVCSGQLCTVVLKVQYCAGPKLGGAKQQIAAHAASQQRQDIHHGGTHMEGVMQVNVSASCVARQIRDSDMLLVIFAHLKWALSSTARSGHLRTIR